MLMPPMATSRTPACDCSRVSALLLRATHSDATPNVRAITCRASMAAPSGPRSVHITHGANGLIPTRSISSASTHEPRHSNPGPSAGGKRACRRVHPAFSPTFKALSTHNWLSTTRTFDQADVECLPLKAVLGRELVEGMEIQRRLPRQVGQAELATHGMNLVMHIAVARVAA